MLRDQFGAQWTYGDIPSMGWVYALQDMKPEELKKGIDNIAHREDSHWPPNAQEFADLCRTDYTWQTRCHRPIDKALLENKRHLHPDNIALGKQTFADIWNTMT